MSLAKRIAARMLGKKQPAPAPRAEVAAFTPKKPKPAEKYKQAKRAPEPDLAQALAALPLPPPTPEVAPAVIRTGWSGSCKALDADTGRRCAMPAHPNEPDRHRHERGPFFRVAAPGQSTFTVRAQLDAAATRRFTTETL